MISNRIRLIPRGRRHSNTDGSNNSSIKRSNWKNVSLHSNQLLLRRVTGLDQLCREDQKPLMRESSRWNSSMGRLKRTRIKQGKLWDQKVMVISSHEWKSTSKKKRKLKTKRRRLLSVKDIPRRSLTRWKLPASWLLRMEKSRGCWRGRNWSCALRFRSRPPSLARSPSKRETSPRCLQAPSAANTNSTGRWRTTWSSSWDSTSWIITRSRRRSPQHWTRLLASPKMQAPPSRDISLPERLLLRQSSLAVVPLVDLKLKNLLSQDSQTSLNRPKCSNHSGRKPNNPHQIHIERPKIRRRWKRLRK